MADSTTTGASGDTLTRDLSTLSENSPGLTAYETPSARAAYTDRPAFSPVAQPGMSPEIWYHTVPGQGQIAGYAPPSNGMIARLNGASQTVKVDLGGGGTPHKRKPKPKPRRKDEKESREQQQDENARERRRDRRGRH